MIEGLLLESIWSLCNNRSDILKREKVVIGAERSLKQKVVSDLLETVEPIAGNQ